MKKETPLICLPTDKPAKIGNKTLFLDNGTLRFGELVSKDNPEKYPTCHIYALSNEEIKEGDWCVNPENQVLQCISLAEENIFNKLCKKIIATSNPDLWKAKWTSGEYEENTPHQSITSGIAKLPLSLIEHYAKYQPKSVMLEYEKYFECPKCRNTENYHTNSEEEVLCNECGYYGKYSADKLKFTSSEEMCWSPVEKLSPEAHEKVQEENQ